MSYFNSTRELKTNHSVSDNEPSRPKAHPVNEVNHPVSPKGEPIPSHKNRNLCVFTSGGDAQGMNAAVRAVVRTALDHGLEVYASLEGYQGLVDGGDRLRQVYWDDVSGILHQGGTVIGTARCQDFREREGRLKAARHLLERSITSLVVIGGDGSLTGANLFRQEWPDLLATLVAEGTITQEQADQHPVLTVVGLVGSIDNDMSGTDMTIGADSALCRITEAIDAIGSTAASHQRSFVIEVMGRNCGYLALMSAIATGADWVVIPEYPPIEGWENKMCQVVQAHRKAGRRDSIIIVAEGAHDRQGNPITCEYVKQLLENRLGEDTRITILGHVQRGGAPSAFDRYMSTVLGHAAVKHILNAKPDDEACLIGMQENRVHPVSLMACVEKTHSIKDAIGRQDYDTAISLRGSSFRDSIATFRTLARARPHPPTPGQRRLRLAVMNASAPAPGMNTATRAAIRLGLDEGHIMMGIRDGFEGLIEGDLRDMAWRDVEHWASRGGSELGTNRKVPSGSDFYKIARTLEEAEIDGLLIIGGWAGYEAAFRLQQHREQYPAFDLPMVCLPASINNNLPGSEFSVGADTALNSIVDVVDKIKQSGVASNRTFVVEVMGRHCGYLALMSGLATGAERVYMHEEGVTLSDLKRDVDSLNEGFLQGKRLGLIIRSESANPIYTTAFMCALFEEEGGDLYTVRQAILGHLQQGGDPSPFDRIQATRLASQCIEHLVNKVEAEETDCAFIGLQSGRVRFHDLQDFHRMVDKTHQRPKKQWWMGLRPIARVLAQPGPKAAYQ